MPKYKYEVRVDEAANDKMTRHLRFLAQVSLSATKRLRAQLHEAVKFLQTSADTCPLYLFEQTINADLKYHLFGKRYSLVFEIVGNDVFVHDIQDCRQGTNKNLV